MLMSDLSYSESRRHLNTSILSVRHFKDILFAFALTVLAFLITDFSYAQKEGVENQMLISKLSAESTEKTMIDDFMQSIDFSADSNNNSGRKEMAYIYTNSDDLRIKTNKLKKEDILQAVPSISTENNQTLGLLIPPFAYFAKRF